MIQFPSSVPAPPEYVEACLLLSLAERPAYGYELKRELDDFGIEVADRGRIYRALRSMEKRGLITSRWDTTVSRARPGGPTTSPPSGTTVSTCRSVPSAAGAGS